MAKPIRVRRCVHCGEILQSNDPSEKGYINPDILNQYGESSLLYCNNCYAAMMELTTPHYLSNVNDGIMNILKDAVATDALIIWVVDLFSFCGDIDEDVAKQIKNLKVCVVGTKRDLFSSNIEDATFERYLKESFNNVGVEPYSIKLFGNTDDIDGNVMIEALNIARQGHDVYMIGSLSSGKTSLINKVLKSFVNKSNKSITTEQYPGTDITTLQIPLSNSSYFYELPGFDLNTSISTKVEKDVAKLMVPHKKIKIVSKSVNDKDTLMIGNIAKFKFENCKSFTVKLFTAEDVECKKIKSDHSKEFFMENFRRRTVRPVSDRLISFTDFDMIYFDIENDDEIHDIAIEGLGWISLRGYGQRVYVSVPKGVMVNETLGKVR